MQTIVRHAYFTKVIKVQEMFQKHLQRIPDPDATGGSSYLEVPTSLGWFVSFEGSHESLCFGTERPDLAVGDIVKVTFEKQMEKKHD